MKQETLEDAARRYADITHNRPLDEEERYYGYYQKHDGFMEGAKWRQERSYSAEEVIAIVEKSRETGLTAEFLLLTEQFKKK